MLESHGAPSERRGPNGERLVSHRHTHIENVNSQPLCHVAAGHESDTRQGNRAGDVAGRQPHRASRDIVPRAPASPARVRSLSPHTIPRRLGAHASTPFAYGDFESAGERTPRRQSRPHPRPARSSTEQRLLPAPPIPVAFSSPATIVVPFASVLSIEQPPAVRALDCLSALAVDGTSKSRANVQTQAQPSNEFTQGGHRRKPRPGEFLRAPSIAPDNVFCQALSTNHLCWASEFMDH